MGEWSPWSTCEVPGADFSDNSLPRPIADPADAVHSSTYTITTEASNGGSPCAESNGEEKTEACQPVVTNYVDWTFQDPVRELRLVVCPLGGAVRFDWSSETHDVFEMHDEAACVSRQGGVTWF